MHIHLRVDYVSVLELLCRKMSDMLDDIRLELLMISCFLFISQGFFPRWSFPFKLNKKQWQHGDGGQCSWAGSTQRQAWARGYNSGSQPMGIKWPFLRVA